jgi:hypothetical protein
MFERFTEGARQVIVLAQEESCTLKHDYIGTEHLLLGLIREEHSVAARVLKSFGITLERARREVVRLVGEGQAAGPRQIPFTPAAKRVLELALREAKSPGDESIYTEHLLLGLAREDAGVATRIMDDFDADAEKIRNEVLRIQPQTAAERRIRRQARVELRVDEPIQVGLTPRARRIWMSAAARALDEGRTAIAPGDLLEPLISDETTRSLLSELGVDLAALQERLRATAWTEPDDPEAA